MHKPNILELLVIYSNLTAVEKLGMILWMSVNVKMKIVFSVSINNWLMLHRALEDVRSLPPNFPHSQYLFTNQAV